MKTQCLTCSLLAVAQRRILVQCHDQPALLHHQHGSLHCQLLPRMLFLGLWVTVVYCCSYVIYMSRPDDCFWVDEAEVSGQTQILGMVAVVAKQNSKERFGELFQMIISPTYRRMGLGVRMTQTVIDVCKERGFSKVVLETRSTQKAAVALYKRLGFNIVLIHKTTESPFWITLFSQITVVQMEKLL